MLDWLPQQVSSYGGDIDSLIRLIYILTGIWFVVLHGLLIYMLIRYRRREGVRAQYLPGVGKRQLAWIFVPTLIVLVLDFWVDERGNKVWGAIKRSMPPVDVEVRVTGKQFNWEILYPGPDGQFDTRDDYKTENSMNVPVGKVVRVNLRSKDTLHSFFLPELRLKQDTMPGREIPIWFSAVQTGKFEIGCAELCGVGHTTMRGFLNVLDENAWDQWKKKRWPAAYAAAAPPPPAAEPAPAATTNPDPAAPAATPGGDAGR